MPVLVGWRAEEGTYPLVAIVTVLALIQYVVQGVRVGQARQRYGVEAPATAGHAIFERHFRVHQNTLEQLVIFLPAMWLFGWYEMSLTSSLSLDPVA